MKTLNDLINSTKGMTSLEINDVVTQHVDESLEYLRLGYSVDPNVLLHDVLKIQLTAALAKIHDLTAERNNLERLLNNCNTQFTKLLSEHS